MRKTSVLLIFALVLLPVIAGAQMMGGGNHHGSSPATPPANGMHGGNGPMNGAMGDMTGMGNHRRLMVGSDGTVYAVRISNPATPPSPATFEIVAVRQNGAIGWTAPVNTGMTFIELSGNHLLVTTSPHGFDMGSSPTTAASTLVALSAASGSEQWTLQLDGFAFDFEPFAGGTYITVFKPAQSNNSAGMHGGNGEPASNGTRTLLAVGTDGKVLWSVPLTK